MERYAIFEGNMDRLVKKLNRISNKCSRFGCSFVFNIVGEEFRDIKNEQGRVETLRFVIVEAEGVAKLNDWRFIASVEHTEKGNIINRADFAIEVPERFYSSSSICEHCGTNRVRKDTFIVMNETTGEFKQVGKSCLADFTGGLSAEAIARYYSWFDELVKGEAVDFSGGHSRYFETAKLLPYYAETVRKFGFVKKFDDYGYGNSYPTASRGFDYFALLELGWAFNKETRKMLLNDIDRVSFNPSSPEAIADTEAALAWLAEQEGSNNYLHNLKTVCAMQYVSHKHLGIMASLFATWKRETAKAEEKREWEAKKAVQKKLSRHVGDVGQRFTFKVTSFELLTSWQTDYGTTYLYKMTDEAGNVLVWKSSKWIEEPDAVKTVTGTVKAHSEFNMIKQTEITRCKVA